MDSKEELNNQPSREVRSEEALEITANGPPLQSINSWPKVILLFSLKV